MRKKVKKASKKMDKLITGLIVGGAVGSVVGMALSPKSGKENRKYVKNKAEEAIYALEKEKPKKKSFLGKLFTLIKRILSLFSSND